jgi:hypothetical protein
MGMKGLQHGGIIPALFTIVGGLTLLPRVNKYVVYVPIPVGGTLIAIGMLMATQ